MIGTKVKFSFFSSSLFTFSPLPIYSPFLCSPLFVFPFSFVLLFTFLFHFVYFLWASQTYKWLEGHFWHYGSLRGQIVLRVISGTPSAVRVGWGYWWRHTVLRIKPRPSFMTGSTQSFDLLRES